MKEKLVIKIMYKLLHNALIDIREEAYIVKNKRIYGMADLFHNLPLELQMLS